MFKTTCTEVFEHFCDANTCDSTMYGKSWTWDYENLTDFQEDFEHFRCDVEIKADEMSKILGEHIEGKINYYIDDKEIEAFSNGIVWKGKFYKL